MPELPATPTLDKRSKVIEESQSIGRFLDWLSDQGIHLAKWNEPRDGYEPELFYINEGPSALLHRYFDIDPHEEEKELQSLIDIVRGLNQP